MSEPGKRGILERIGPFHIACGVILASLVMVACSRPAPPSDPGPRPVYSDRVESSFNRCFLEYMGDAHTESAVDILEEYCWTKASERAKSTVASWDEANAAEGAPFDWSAFKADMDAGFPEPQVAR